MSKSLKDAIVEQEAQEEKENAGTPRKRKALGQISSQYGSKDKQISAKVNTKVYDLFTEINRAQGISNNSALNMILTKYVRENKEILDEI